MAGLSAGGAATYNVGLKHLELFSAFGLFSAAGGGGADFATRYPQLAADPKDANAKINVFWIGCGTEDPLDAGAKTLDAELTRAADRPHLHGPRRRTRVAGLAMGALGVRATAVPEALRQAVRA